MNDKLVSKPRIKLSDKLVDSFQSSDLFNNLSFKRVVDVIFPVLEAAPSNILFDKLDRPAVIIVENMNNTIDEVDEDEDDNNTIVS